MVANSSALVPVASANLSVLLRQIRAEIGDAPQTVHRVGRIRVGGKDIRHFLRADLAPHRVHHVLLQIVDRAEA